MKRSSSRPSRLHGVNRIPIERGLGSSAAAAVAGANIANALLYALSITEDPSGPDLVVADAVAFEGHPDNVLAAMFGGLTVALAGEYAPTRSASEPRPSRAHP